MCLFSAWGTKKDTNPLQCAVRNLQPASACYTVPFKFTRAKTTRETGMGQDLFEIEGENRKHRMKVRPRKNRWTGHFQLQFDLIDLTRKTHYTEVELSREKSREVERSREKSREVESQNREHFSLRVAPSCGFCGQTAVDGGDCSL